MKSTYRAWSNDWSKSLTFSQDLINSKKWVAFKKHCLNVLGDGWGWELALNTSIKMDISHIEFNTFNS